MAARARVVEDDPAMLGTFRELLKKEGLDAGADGYLTKPFSDAELLARARAF